MKKLLFISLAVLLFAGCQKESISENKAQFDAVSESNQANNTKARPLSGNLTNAPNPDAAPILCSGVIPVSGQNFIYGNVSHLGQLKPGSLGTALNCDITNFPSALDPSLRGTVTYNEVWVAANGDKVFNFSTIYIVGNVADGGATGTWTGSGTITGGTGRFEGASGSWDFVNGRYFADGTSAWSISGSITY
jgi:hypothetical protein